MYIRSKTSAFIMKRPFKFISDKEQTTDKIMQSRTECDDCFIPSALLKNAFKLTAPLIIGKSMIENKYL